MAFTGRLGQSDSTLANIRLGYWAAVAPPGLDLAGASHGVATVAGALSMLWALAGASAGVATVSGTLITRRAVELTQEVIESDVNRTEGQRRLSQLVIEADHDPVLQRSLSQEVVEPEVDSGPLGWQLFQFVIEVDGENWGFGAGRILSAQFV